MQINLSRLKLQPQGSERFFLEGPGSEYILEELGGTFLDKIVVDLQVENTGRMFLARGTVQTVLSLPCSRCLVDFNLPVHTDIDMTIVAAGQADLLSEDEDAIVFHGDIVDLNVPVHEAIFMAIPIVPLCKEDCRGLCSVCGMDKNQGDCSCINQEIDPRWEKLKNL